MSNCAQKRSAKQENAINKLSAKVVRYQMQIDETNDKIGKNPCMEFDEYTTLREKIKMYEGLKTKAKEEIEEIDKQNELYHKHIRQAKAHMDAAEEIKKRWF